MIGKYKIAALCLSRVHDQACNELVASLNECLRNMGYVLMVYNTCSDLYWDDAIAKGESSVFKLIPFESTDVIVIFEEKIKGSSVVAEIKNNAAEHNVPIINIGEQSENCVNIQFDYELGFSRVVEHVIDVHKPKTLHFMGGIKDNEFSVTRLESFKKVLESRNIPFDDSMVSYGEFWSVPAQKATEKLIDENRVPDAIICANDSMAVAVVSTLKQHGFAVPGDVIVTGFDGIDEIYYSNPRITSCMCSHKELAEKIADIIPGCVSGEYRNQSFYVSPSPILSQSCGCPEKNVLQLTIHGNIAGTNLHRYIDEERVLSEISAKIQTCDNLRQIAEKLVRSLIFDMHVMLKKECTDETANPLTIRDPSFGDMITVLFDSDRSDSLNTYDIPASEIIPNLNTYFDAGCALIFTALNFLNVPLGYLCFHYHDYDIQNYCKIPQLTNALNNAIGGFRNMRYQNHLWSQLEEMYMFDSLTGLYNRGGFAKAYKNLACNTDGLVTVVLADLDGLKYINDNYGHGEGDVAISTVAAALRHACPPNALCVRFGGDEMLAVIPGDCDEASIRSSMNAFLDARNAEYGKAYEISTSVGIYSSQRPEELDFEELIKDSDKLMYEEKQLKKKLREEKNKRTRA